MVFVGGGGGGGGGCGAGGGGGGGGGAHPVQVACSLMSTAPSAMAGLNAMINVFVNYTAQLPVCTATTTTTNET